MKKTFLLILLFCLSHSFASDSVRQTWPSVYSVVTTRCHYTIHVTWDDDIPPGTYYIGAGAGIPGSGAQAPWVVYGFSIVGPGGHFDDNAFFSAADNQVTQGVTTFSEKDMRGISCQNASGTLFPVSGGRVLTGESHTGASSTTPTATADSEVTLNYHIGVVTKHPEHLNLEFQNKTGKSAVLLVRSPTGAIVVNVGVGPNQNYTGGWDPPDSAALGAYTLVFGYVDQYGNGPISAVGSVTLSAAPSDSPYSKIWSDNSPSGSLSGDGGGPGDPNSPQGNLKNNTGSDVSLVWKNELGQTVGTLIVPAGGNVALSSSNIPTPTAGTSSNLTLVDSSSGQVVGTINVANPGDGIAPVYGGPINAVFNGAPPSNTPTTDHPNTGNTPSGTQTNNGNSTATTTVNNSTSTVMTNQDIYNDVRKAIEDAEPKNFTLPPVSVPADWNPGANIDDYPATVSGIQTKAESLVSGGDASSLDTPFSAPTISSGTPHVTIPAVGLLPEFVVDWSAYLTYISVFRALCLVAMSIIFWIANQRAAASAIA